MDLEEKKPDKGKGDGSIYVCFICEKEFRKIDLLNEHMASHDKIPEMHNDFPSRKRRKKKIMQDYTKSTSSNSIKEKEGKYRSPSKFKEIKKTPGIMPKGPPLPSQDSKVSKNGSLSKPIVNNASKAKEKSDPNPEAAALRRAMRIKQYIESKELQSSKKSAKGEESVGESIMMVDSSYFNNSNSSLPPNGPTIMNAEPEGFICPAPKFPSKKEALSASLKKRYGFSISEDIDCVEELPDDDDSQSLDSDCDSPKPPARRGRGRPPLSFKGVMRGASKMRERIKVRRGKPGRRSRPRQEDEETGSYQCLECFKQYRSLSTMKVHLRSHSENKEIPCPYCTSVFPQRYLLYEHLVENHEECSNLTCPVCNKIFTRPDSLKSHMVRMHEDEGGLNCIVCGKNFPSQAQLEIHIRVHTGERPFKCEICRKGFVQKVHLRTHLRTMHNATNIPTTPCRLCEKMFDSRTSLRDHYTSFHKLTSAQYRVQVASLRKEGRISDALPPEVRVVEPSFHYQKVPVSQVCKKASPKPKTKSTTFANQMAAVFAGKKLKVNPSSKGSRERRAPGMGTILNMNDDVMFTPSYSEGRSEHSKKRARDQEELNLVESAFKVAEEMEQLSDSSSTFIISADDSSSSIYYTLPAAIDASSTTSLTSVTSKDLSKAGQTCTTTTSGCQIQSLDLQQPPSNSTKVIEHGSLEDIEGNEYVVVDGLEEVSRDERQFIIKSEPLEVLSSAGSSQTVDMLTM